MKYSEFKKYLERDGGRCYHCGKAGDDLVPQHRAGRGMGGSKERHRPSNIITLCSIANGLLESDPAFAELGREYGWKLSGYADPTASPVLEIGSWTWWILDDDGSRRPQK